MREVTYMEVDGDDVAVMADWSQPASPIWIRWGVHDRYGLGSDEGWEPTPWQVADCAHSQRQLRFMLTRQCERWDEESTADHLQDWLDVEAPITAPITAETTDEELEHMALTVVEDEAEEGVPLAEDVVVELLAARRARLRREMAQD